MFILCSILSTLVAQTRLFAGGRHKAGSLDVVGCLVVVEQCLGTAAPTTTNTTTARVALSLAANRDTFKVRPSSS